MRLHSLEIAAFGPFKAPQSVDFDRLSTGGLFLLEGPTGAGKTTILDAITYALYGRLSVSTATTDRLYCGYAESGDKPSVALEFSVGVRRFRVTRTPPYPRPKLRGEGDVDEKPTAHLESLNGATWTSESSEIKEVTAEITRIIGLTGNQFTQVAILPQGEFAKFLRADDDQRRELLTTLFETHLYDKITAELEDRAKSARRGLDQAKVAIGNACAAAMEAAGCDEARRALVNEMSDEKRRDEFVAIAKELAEASAARATAHTEARAALDSARAEEQRLLRLLNLAKAHANARRDADEHERTRDQHVQRMAELDLATKAAPLRPLLDALEEANIKLASEHQRLSEIETNPSEEHVDGLGGEAEEQLAADLVRRAGELQHLVDEERALPYKESDQRSLEDDANDAHDELTKLSLLNAELPGRITQARLAWASAEKLANAASAQKETLAHLAGQLDAAKALAASGIAELALNAGQTAADSARQDASVHYQMLVKAKLAGMSAELALKLVDGEPCLVCGASEHPSPASGLGDRVSDEVLSQAKATSEDADKKCAATRAELAELRESRAKQRGISHGQTTDTLENSVHAQKLLVTSAQQAQTQLEALSTELVALENEYLSAAERLRSASAKEAIASQAATAGGVELARIREEIEMDAQGHPSVGAQQEALRSQARQRKAIASRIQAIAHALQDVSETSNRAEAQAREGGFSTVADARLAFVGPALVADLRAQVESWAQSHAGFVARLADPDFQEVAASDVDSLASLVQSAVLDRESCQSAETAAIGQHVRTESQQTAFARCLIDVDRAEDAHCQLSASTASVVQLDGLTRGVAGSRRVSLTTYVLRTWFQHVAEAANIRLATMSSGRYLLNRIDESNERTNARSGLTLEIVDQHTGKTRHPESLSGGETFFTALALALGLADVVKSEAGGVDLDTLFIDEGFGTLDPDTLDRVMDVIEDLRERGRVVGIISHVAELKDRVNERLEVRQVDTAALHGPSLVRVVA